MSNIADGAVVTFLCRGFLEGNRFLNGLTDAPAFGGVDLEIRPDDVNLTGTFWQCSQVADRIFTFACAGKIPGPRYLNGNTYDGSVSLVGDTLDPFSGTRWLVQQTNLGDDTVTLWCQGYLDNPDYRYLDGRTLNSTVGLAPNSGDSYSGTRWATQVVGEPMLSAVVVARFENASEISVRGTNFHPFDRILFAAEGIVGRVDHIPLNLWFEGPIVNADAFGAFNITSVVDLVREQPRTQPAVLRAYDQHGLSAVALTDGFSY